MVQMLIILYQLMRCQPKLQKDSSFCNFCKKNISTKYSSISSFYILKRAFIYSTIRIGSLVNGENVHSLERVVLQVFFFCMYTEDKF